MSERSDYFENERKRILGEIGLRDEDDTVYAKWIEKIDKGEFSVEDVPAFMDDYFGKYAKKDEESASRNKDELRKRIDIIKPQLAEHFKCPEEQIIVGDLSFEEAEDDVRKVQARIVFGNVVCSNSNISDLGDLEYVEKSLIISGCYIRDTGKVKYIGEDFDSCDSDLERISEVEYIGGNATCGKNVKDIGKLKHCIGKFDCSESRDLKNLQNLVYLGKTPSLGGINNLGNVRIVEDELICAGDERIDEFPKLEYVGGQLVLGFDSIGLPKKLSVDGDLFFTNSQIREVTDCDLVVGGNVYYGKEYREEIPEKDGTSWTLIEGGIVKFDDNVKVFGDIVCDDGKKMSREDVATKKAEITPNDMLKAGASEAGKSTEAKGILQELTPEQMTGILQNILDEDDFSGNK